MPVKPISTLDERLKRTQPRGAGAMSNGRVSTMMDATPKLQRGLGNPEGRSDKRSSDVSHIAAGMMKQSNPLMRRAESEGMKLANSRGLLNSSIAVGEAQNQVLDRIVPLASQEASQRHDLNLSDKEFDQTLELQKREQDFTTSERIGGFEQTLQLQDREQDFTRSEREAAFANTMEQLGAEQAFAAAESQAEREQAAALLAAELNSDFNLAQLDAQTRENLVRIESQYEQALLGMELDAQSAEIAADMFVSLQGQYSQTLQTIINNPDMSAEDRNALIDAQQGMLDAQITAIEGMNGVNIDFATGAVNVNGSGTPSAPYPTAPSPVGPIAPVGPPAGNENAGYTPGVIPGIPANNVIGSGTAPTPAAPTPAPQQIPGLSPRPVAPRSNPAPAPTTAPKPKPRRNTSPRGGKPDNRRSPGTSKQRR